MIRFWLCRFHFYFLCSLLGHVGEEMSSDDGVDVGFEIFRRRGGGGGLFGCGLRWCGCLECRRETRHAGRSSWLTQLRQIPVSTLQETLDERRRENTHWVIFTAERSRGGGALGGSQTYPYY